MNIIDRWLAKKEEKAKAAKDQQLLEEQKSKEQHREKVAELTTSMTSRPCAINDMNKCSIECVHFKKGRVLYNVWTGWGYTHDKPRCKLWK